MKIPYAARFTVTLFAVAALYTWLQMQPGLTFLERGAGDFGVRASWLADNALTWRMGWWLWLVAIFSWMLLLVVLGWSYLPAHRVAGALQSGLMIIAAVLTIAGINGWMGVLPVAVSQEVVSQENHAPFAALVEAFARTLVASGVMMGGITTAWIALDLWRGRLLPPLLLLLLGASGVCAALAGFFLLERILMVGALAGWLAATGWLSTQRRLPPPFPAWPGLSNE
jgi:hypothetical protein